MQPETLSYSGRSMSAQYVFNLTVQLGCPLPVRDNLNKYVYSTTRIGNIWYMEPEPAQAEFVYAILYRLALFLSEITVKGKPRLCHRVNVL